MSFGPISGERIGNGTMLHRGKSLPPNQQDGSRPAVFRFAVLAAIFLALYPLKMEGQLLSRKNVLIVTEVGLSHPGAALVIQALQNAFENTSEYRVEFYMESLDTMSFPAEEDQLEIEQTLVRRYSKLNLDGIVAMGPSAIRFLARSPEKFAGVPVIICCSTIEQAGYPPLDSRFTGAWFSLEPQKTVDLGLSLFPGTEHIFVVGGNTLYDKTLVDITKAKLIVREPLPDITYLADLNMSALLERLAHLPAHSIVLYTSFWRDAAGNQFVNATVALPMVTTASNAPVFGLSDTYIGHGVIGGFAVSFSQETTRVTDVLRQILRGVPPDRIPIDTIPGSFVFDWRQLQRWNLQKANLPGGSVVLFRELGGWEKNREMVAGGIALVLILCIFAGYLFFKQKQLTSTKLRLSKLSGMLIESQENERRRLASELHDDFSQRLALLSIGLETVERLILASPEQAGNELRMLVDAVSEIGTDLHTVSHRLHSSTLHRLGLIAGINTFCREFSSQFSVKVEFNHHDVPRNVPPDIALCLFRVVQEALRNVHKHSGSQQAEVDLRARGGRLLLSIRDRGVGFEVNSVTGQGLGLLSMAERCRLYGGEFALTSQPGKGTTIDVWLPGRVSTNEGMLAAAAHS